MHLSASSIASFFAFAIVGCTVTTTPPSSTKPAAGGSSATTPSPSTATAAGGAASGSGSASGKPDGQPLAVADAYAHVSDDADTGGKSLEIELADHAGLCTTPNVKFAGGRSLAFSLPMSADAIAVGTQTFERSTAPGAGHALIFKVGGDDCSGNENTATGDSGTVTITEVTDARVKGTFNVMFGAEAVSGEFDAALCESAITNTAKTVCGK